MGFVCLFFVFFLLYNGLCFAKASSFILLYAFVLNLCKMFFFF